MYLTSLGGFVTLSMYFLCLCLCISIDQGHCCAGKAAVVMLRGWWAKRTHKNLGLVLYRSIISGPWALEECQGCGVLLGRAHKSPKIFEKQLTGVPGSFGHDSPDKEGH